MDDYGYSYDTDYSYGSDYGYADYSTMSTEAAGYADQAWAAGDMDSYNAWSSESWSAWGTSTDMYASGYDAYGSDSLASSDSYYDYSW